MFFSFFVFDNVFRSFCHPSHLAILKPEQAFLAGSPQALTTNPNYAKIVKHGKTLKHKENIEHVDGYVNLLVCQIFVNTIQKYEFNSNKAARTMNRYKKVMQISPNLFKK